MRIVVLNHPRYGYVKQIEKEINRIALIVRQVIGLHRAEREKESEISVSQLMPTVNCPIIAWCDPGMFLEGSDHIFPVVEPGQRCNLGHFVVGRLKQTSHCFNPYAIDFHLGGPAENLHESAFQRAAREGNLAHDILDGNALTGSFPYQLQGACDDSVAHCLDVS